MWQYVAREQLELPAIYFAHEREVFERDGMLYAASEFVERYDDEVPFTEWVRFRTVGDMSCTGGVRSQGGDDRRGRGGDRRHAGHRARRDARGRQGVRGGDGGPEACRILLAATARRAPSRSLTDSLLSRRRRARAPRHVRLGRRRQVDADRTAALRHEAGVRRPARARRGDERAPWRRVRQPRAAHRRPARRARAGDHDRRRLPVVRHRAAPLPARRRTGARPVHAQHGHRRLDRRRRDRAARRAQGSGRADAAARLDRAAARRPARRLRREQDGPRRLRRGALPRDRGRAARSSPARSASATRSRSRWPRCTATTSSTAPSACRGGTGGTLLEPPGDGRDRRRPRRSPIAASPCSG